MSRISFYGNVPDSWIPNPNNPLSEFLAIIEKIRNRKIRAIYARLEPWVA